MTTSTKTRAKKPAAAKKAAVAPTLETVVVPAYKAHMHPTVLREGKYTNGQVAIRGFDASTKEPVYMATVALPYKPAQGCVWLKTWSENSGLVDQLIIAGVVSLTGRVQLVAGTKVFALEGRLLV